MRQNLIGLEMTIRKTKVTNNLKMEEYSSTNHICDIHNFSSSFSLPLPSLYQCHFYHLSLIFIFMLELCWRWINQITNLTALFSYASTIILQIILDTFWNSNHMWLVRPSHIKFDSAKYYKDSEMTTYISERSRNSK